MVNFTVEKCTTICNGTFKQGLSAFLRYVYKLGSQYYNDEIKLTSAELDEVTLGATIFSIYTLDAMETWSN